MSESSRRIRAKFVVSEVRDNIQAVWEPDEKGSWKDTGRREKQGESVYMNAVYGSEPGHPNKVWSDSSPSGSFQMMISNKGAWGALEVGKEYYFDISLAED